MAKPFAPYAVLHIDNMAIYVTIRQVPYDSHHFLLAFEKKNIPAREFILRVFDGNQHWKKVKHANCLPIRSLAAAFFYLQRNIVMLHYIA